MAQPQLLQIKLSRFDAQPWGFRLQGGVDFAAPLLVQKINSGSLAEQAGLLPGDAVIKINDVDVYNLRHKDAQDIVVRSGNNFVITVERGGSTTWRPQVTPVGHVPQPQTSPYLQTVTKTSLAHKQQDVEHIGCGYNNAARPFVNGGDGNVKSIVNKQYNTPVGIYSEESIAETLSAQAEVLAGGVLGVNFKKNEREYQPDKSEVLKFLREEETGQSTPEPQSPAQYYWTQSHAVGSAASSGQRTPQHIYQRQHQQHQQHKVQQQQQIKSSTLTPGPIHRPSVPIPASTHSADATKSAGTTCVAPAAVAIPQIPDPRSIVVPICPALQGPEYAAELKAAAASTEDCAPRPLSASGHPACQLCGVGIVGVFVRIKDKNLHVECFKCATCGTSLKNQGYYNFNNKLYCDIHAKLAALQNPPKGTEGYVPVPIRPNTKLSANTISTALSAHGYNGVSNGSSTPTPAPAPLEDVTDLPLPPPPSPLQLQQFENDSQFNNNLYSNSTNDQYIRTHSSLSCQSSGSNASSMSPLPTTGTVTATTTAITVNCGASASGSTASETGNSVASTTSPMHSNQNSISSLDEESYLPPPPPPPMPTTNEEMQQQQIKNNKLSAKTLQQQQQQQQNENDMNMQNKNKAAGNTNAYNQFLKGYSNKLPTQNNNNNSNTTHINQNKTMPTQFQNSSNNNNNLSCNKNTQLINETAKPFTPTLTSSMNNSAASSAVANQLKPNSYQIAALTTATSATEAFNTNNSSNFEHKEAETAYSLSNMLSTIPDEQSSIYGQINVNNPSSNIAQQQPQQTALEQQQQQQQPFEYVTLTGNVIRSVVPPGKGANINYKVNQGYARPFGAGGVAPPTAAPKSPVSYPPQPQQWAAQPPQQQSQQRPAVNPYATLPRSNVGQQGRHNYNKTYNQSYQTQYKRPTVGPNRYSTLPHYNNSHSTNTTTDYHQQQQRYQNQNQALNNNYLNRGAGGKGITFSSTSAPKRGRGIFNKAVEPGVRIPLCNSCNIQIRGPFITALGRIWCPEHFICVNANCRNALQDIGFVEEKGDLYCEYCFEKYLAPTCSKCGGKIKGDCLNAIGRHFHPECFSCAQCGKIFGNTPFFLEDGNPYCEADWNELFTTKCFACGFPVEAGDRWVEALNHNYHSQCFNCTYCKQNLEGQSFYNKGGRPFCKNHAR